MAKWIWHMGSDAIGGYFGLDVAPVRNWRPEGLALNSARNGLTLWLEARKPRRIYLPTYCCDAVARAIPASIEICWYPINGQFEIDEMPETAADAPLLYVNYFGLKERYARALAAQNPDALIIDNSQAYFSPPDPKTACFYSPRKFLPVPDGGILAAPVDAPVNAPGERARSSGRADHLLGRAEQGAEAWFDRFRQVEAEIAAEPPLRMSALTEQLLDHFDTDRFGAQRRANFCKLAESLAPFNQINLSLPEGAVPMVYPFLPAHAGLREVLIENRVFVTRYWPEVQEAPQATPFEREVACNMLPLPVDQRYGAPEMHKIAALCLAHLPSRSAGARP